MAQTRKLAVLKYFELAGVIASFGWLATDYHNWHPWTVFIAALGAFVGIEFKERYDHSSNIQTLADESDVPNLSGRWEGWTYRTLTKEWRPSAQEITQKGLVISANAWGPDNWARGLCASIVHDHSAYELVWSYRTEPTTPNYGGGDSHTGTHFLRFSERDGQRFLEGRYVTDRPRDDGTFGAGGSVTLKWMSKALKTALDYDENKPWGLAKPKKTPSPRTGSRR